MKKISMIYQFSRPLMAAFISIVLLSGCSSEYHWVKAHSADPELTKKVDIAQVIPKDAADPARTNQMTADANGTKNPSVRTPSQLVIPAPSAPSHIDHGYTAITKLGASAKAKEIENSLSDERKKALHSSDLAIRTQAIKETLHEQFSKTAGYEKLSAHQQERVERSMSAKIAKKGTRNGLAGFNTLLLYGLILLVVSIIFFAVPGIEIIGVIFAVVAAVLIILGLVQMLG